MVAKLGNAPRSTCPQSHIEVCFHHFPNYKHNTKRSNIFPSAHMITAPEHARTAHPLHHLYRSSPQPGLNLSHEDGSIEVTRPLKGSKQLLWGGVNLRTDYNDASLSRIPGTLGASTNIRGLAGGSGVGQRAV